MPGVTTAYQTGAHGSRPAASAGCILYSCTDHGLVYRSDGSAWSTWATLGGSGSAPDSATYITATSDGTLSAEIPRPELDDQTLAGATPITFTSPTCDDASLTTASETGMACRLTCTEQSTRRHAYVSSAVGTGDFDYRFRITDLTITVPHSGASAPLIGFFVADSSLTTSTRLSIQVQVPATNTFASPYSFAVVGTTGSGQQNFGVRFPIILRIKRTGTTVTFYSSSTEGRTWTLLSTVTSSLNVARIGAVMLGGSAGTQTSVALIHWLRSF